MRELVGPISRILARVLAGVLIGAGYFSEETTQGIMPDFEALLGFGLWALTEALYALAKRRGWAT